MDRIEKATSGRASCRGCRTAIAKDDLRFGEASTNPFGDGSFVQWYHLACAAEKRPDKLAPVLAKYKKAVPDRAALEASLGTATRGTRLAKLVRAERAPTGRSICDHCKLGIAHKTLRAVVRIDTDPSFTRTAFLHLACARAFAGQEVAAHLATRSKALTKPDRAELAAILAAVELLDRDPRGRALERDARAALGQKPTSKRRGPTRASSAKSRAAAKRTAVVDANVGEIAVLADWLEERGHPVAVDEVARIVRARSAAG